MLVFTRRVGQEIVIDGGRIRVRLTAASPGKARIGIVAPRAVVVDREEVHRRRQENLGAAVRQRRQV